MNSNFQASQASLDLMDNEYAWDGKCPAFQSDRGLFFFKREIFRFKKLSACYLSAYDMSA